MFLAAREILHGRAVAVRVDGADIDLQPLPADDGAGLGVSMNQNLDHAGVFNKAVENVNRLGSRDEQIHVADRFLAAPQAAGISDLIHPLDAREILDQLLSGAVGEVDQKPSGASFVAFDAAQDLLFELLAHARKGPQLAVAAELFEPVDGADAEVEENGGDAFRTESSDFEQFERRRRILLQQLIAPLETASLGELMQGRGDSFADALDLGDLALGVIDNCFDAPRVAVDDDRRVAVAPDAEAVHIGDLHQISRFVEE